MANSDAIRAGRAYVELFADDRALRQALTANERTVRESTRRMADESRTAYQSTTRDIAGSAAIATQQVASSGHTVAATAAAATGRLATLKAATLSVGHTFISAGQMMTGSLWRTIATVGVLSAAVRKVAGPEGLARLSSFGRSAGRYGMLASIAGAVTGSTTLREGGRIAQQVSLGTRLFTEGPASALRASAGYLGTRAAVGAIRAPGIIAGGALRGTSAALGTIFPLLRGTSAAADAFALSLAKGRPVALALAATLPTMGLQLVSVGKLFLGWGAAISAAGMGAAKQFASAAADIKRESEETGKSVKELLAKRYGALGGSLISTGDVDKAALLQDAFGELGKSIKAAWAQVGIAVGPVVGRFVETLTRIVQGVAIWASQNRPLIASIFETAAVTGLLAAAVGAVVGGLYLLSPLVGLITSPIGLLAIGFVALTTSMIDWAGVSRAVISSTAQWFTMLYRTASATMVGIGDALAGGDLQLAARIGLAGVELAWLQATYGIRSIWIDLWGWFAKSFFELKMEFQTGWIEAFNVIVRKGIDAFTLLATAQIGVNEQMGLLSKAEADGLRDGTAKAGNMFKAVVAPAGNNQAVVAMANAAVDTMTDLQKQQLRGQMAGPEQNLNALIAQAAAAREARMAELQGMTPQELGKLSLDTGKTLNRERELTTTAVTQFGGGGAGQLGVGGVFDKLAKKADQQLGVLNRIANQNDKVLSFAGG